MVSAPAKSRTEIRPSEASGLMEAAYLQPDGHPRIIWMFIFNYIPMVGIVIGFKNFKITKSIWEAPWVGFEHFAAFFQDESFGNIMVNTLGIALLKLLICFPLPILFAILLNELRERKIQAPWCRPSPICLTSLSWVVLGGIMITWLQRRRHDQ